MIDLSIIIVSWNVRDLLAKCLHSIYNSKQNLSYEIILVDNASTDGTKEMLEHDFPQLVVEYNQNNEGLAKPWNRAASHAQGKYLLFLNDDTEIFDHTLDKCVTYYKSDDKNGVLGVKILNSDKKNIQPSVRRDPNFLNQFLIFIKLPHLFPSVLNKYLCKDFQYNTTQVVEQVMGAFFFMSKNLFNKLNGFDETFFIWFEEVDFCVRTRDLGYKIIYLADTEIIHHGGASFSQLPKLKLQKIFFTSLWHFLSKHYLS